MAQTTHIDGNSDPRPKAILFDIGGVVVASPFQAILDYEARHGIPPGWVNYSISKSAPHGAWQLLETGKIALDASFFANFNDDLHNPQRWRAFQKLLPQKDSRSALPPLPRIDGERLFDEMMQCAAQPDPWIVPALKKLKASGDFVIAALSNTIIFPPGHSLHRQVFLDDPIRSEFDVFVSSAHVGLRKPDPAIYRLALRELNEWAMGLQNDVRGQKRRWEDGITAEEVLFIDDIGANLRAAKHLGFQTIKAHLGKSLETVRRLEGITGLRLVGENLSPDASSLAHERKSKM